MYFFVLEFKRDDLSVRRSRTSVHDLISIFFILKKIDLFVFDKMATLFFYNNRKNIATAILFK